jgi:HEAT repeat protein
MIATSRRAACAAVVTASLTLTSVHAAQRVAGPPEAPPTAPASAQKPATPAAPAAPKPSTPATGAPKPAGEKPAPATPAAAGAPASEAAPPAEAGGPGKPAPAANAQTLAAAIDKLGTLEFPVRMQASRTVRRAPAAQAVPALIAAATKHKDGYVRFRALVLLAGFGDPQVKAVMTGVIDDPNDRLRDVAYAYFERNPDPAMAPRLLVNIDKETSEFVRPSLVRALAALGADPTVQKVMLREATRGQDFFRSSVLAALGNHKAAYALTALTAIAKQDGPLQDDAVLALGQIGDKRVLDTIAAQQRAAPRERQPALAAAICLLGVNCGSHEKFLVQTLDFTVANPGFQDLVRSSANGLSKLAASGRDSAWDILIDKGQHTVDPVRAPMALALASAAVANPEASLAALGRAVEPKAALMLMRDGFDMLEEDFNEEQFYVAIRRAYWKTPEGGPARKAAEALITTLEF